MTKIRKRFDSDPEESSVVLVYCPSYCRENFTVCTFEKGKFFSVCYVDITEDVVDYIPIEFVLDFFSSK